MAADLFFEFAGLRSGPGCVRAQSLQPRWVRVRDHEQTVGRAIGALLFFFFLDCGSVGFG